MKKLSCQFVSFTVCVWFLSLTLCQNLFAQCQNCPPGGLQSGEQGSGGDEKLSQPWPTVATPVIASWNLLSLPLIAANPLYNYIYPGANSLAFEYHGTYTPKDTLSMGQGYWLKFSRADTVSVVGIECDSLSIPVYTGWNMVGSISQPISVNDIESIPPSMETSQIFGYEGGYFIADTIKPAHGYWVKTFTAGNLMLKPSLSGKALQNRIKIVPTSELPPPPPGNDGESSLLPTVYALDQAYPNPFNPTTTIKYQLPEDSKVSLKVYNTLGQLVITLTDQVQDAGFKSVEWNASNVASGVYFYRLDASSLTDPSKTFTKVKKMLLVK